MTDISEVIDFDVVVCNNDRVVNKLDVIVLTVWFDVIIEFVEFLGKCAYLFDVSQIFELSILCYLILDGHVAMISPFLFFCMSLSVDVFSNLLKVVLSSMGQINICVSLISDFSLFIYPRNSI